MARPLRLPVLLAVVCVVATACPTTGGSGSDGAGAKVPRGCMAVQVTVSPEKYDLMATLATAFNGTSAAKKAADGRCAFIRVAKVSSGQAATDLANGWPDEQGDGPKPNVWSPAGSVWGAVLDQRLADKSQPAMAPADAKPFMLTPLVIAMPRPMAEVLGWPSKPLGFGDLIKLAQDPKGWGSLGHPEWGAFKLGKTNPNFSTSALNAIVAQDYSAVGKARGLTLEDVNRPDVASFNKAVESSVVHYGDTTLTFLNNWYRNDARGTALTYVSAVAVEEKSVIDYNQGNPDGILEQGEKPRPPRVPLVAVYPKDGTLFSDHPFYVIDAPWSTPAQKAGGRAFESFIQEADNQRKVLKFGFRPANPQVPAADPIVPANGVDPAQPATTLGVPDPPVLTRVIDLWGQQRKSAQVLLVIDVSGSMGDEVAGGQTKLELAQQAAIEALDQFGPGDQVGLRIFSTGISPDPPTDELDLVPIGPIAADREAIKSKIRSLVPTRGTPLYTAARDSFELLTQRYDASRINAVVLLTDGKNEDPKNDDLDGLLSRLRSGSEGNQTRPVRLFTIAFGKDADLPTLRRMAEATNAAAYDASNPATIMRVFTNVLSNF